MYHMFDVAVAEQVGVVPAILFQNIAFWCQHSMANDTNFHDGLYWTYNSVKALKALFPYLSASQIDTGMKKLINAGLVVKGNYNNSAYDRTAWYAITKNGKSIFEKSKMEIREIENGFPENREPIPYINTYINTDDKTDKSISSNDDDLDGFNTFYSAYPKKKAKQEAIKAWKALKPKPDLIKTILDDLDRRRIGEWNGKDEQYIPYPATYLRGKRWEDEATPAQSPRSYDAPDDESIFW
jgi:hypothetical protein